MKKNILKKMRVEIDYIANSTVIEVEFIADPNIDLYEAASIILAKAKIYNSKARGFCRFFDLIVFPKDNPKKIVDRFFAYGIKDYSPRKHLKIYEPVNDTHWSPSFFFNAIRHISRNLNKEIDAKCYFEVFTVSPSDSIETLYEKSKKIKSYE
ncbi:MAG: hypothetical protein ACP5OG_02360 [Candidatus Nanoarchaeia archaeon]